MKSNEFGPCEDIRLGLSDGIMGVKNGFKVHKDVYDCHYCIGRRIVSGATGLTVAELNIIKMLHGFPLSENNFARLRESARQCLNQCGEFDEVFTLGPIGEYL